jgi:hypothetical protein
MACAGDRSEGKREYRSKCALDFTGVDCQYTQTLCMGCDLTRGMVGGPLGYQEDGIVRAIGIGNVDASYNAAMLLDEQTVLFLQDALEGL